MSKLETNETNTPIETQLKQLDDSVEWFYGEDFSLDQALKKYQDTVNLAQKLEQDLTKFKNQVTELGDFTKTN